MKKRNFFERVVFAFKDTENLKTPILVKDSGDNELRLIEMQNQWSQTEDPQLQAKLSKEIQLFKLGIKGEASVLFELQNSFLPIHIMHDLRISIGEQKAQLDFVVLTRKFILVIEVKNYYGNIVVNDKDEFIRRVYKNNRSVFQEGFYSPIRQVQRQTALLETLLKEREIINKTPIKYAVVFTNPKTILDIQQASNEVKKRVLRADGLVKFISNALKENSPVQFFDNRMSELSNCILSLHHPSNTIQVEDIVEAKLLEETISQEVVNDSTEVAASVMKSTEVVNSNAFENQQLAAALREFRKQEALKANVKAFYIFTNQTLEELVNNKPTTIADLLTIHGIGEQKVQNFGKELLAIIQQYK